MCLCGLPWQGDNRGHKASPKATVPKEEEAAWKLCCNADGTIDDDGKAFFFKRFPDSTKLQQPTTSTKEEAPHKVVYKLQNKLVAQQGELDKSVNRIEQLEAQLEAAKDRAAVISNGIKATKEEISKAETSAAEAKPAAKAGSYGAGGFSEGDFVAIRDIDGAGEIWETYQKMAHQLEQLIKDHKSKHQVPVPGALPSAPAGAEAAVPDDISEVDDSVDDDGTKDASMEPKLEAAKAESNVEAAKRLLAAKKKQEDEEKERAAKKKREDTIKEVEERANKLAEEAKAAASGT